MTGRASHGWAGVSYGPHNRVVTPASASDIGRIFASKGHGPFLARGLGRSYGDCALNTGGTLIDCRFLDRFISFDTRSGVLECEAGVSMGEINRVLAAKGWMLPVVPGTQFVTVGGAISNDVHGKNHVQEGSFGTHLISIKLTRSDGESLDCSARKNAELFSGTIGGLGLTGLIVSAKIQLRQIKSLLGDINHLPFKSLEELFSLENEHSASWEYHAAWMDPAAACRKGTYIIARHTVQPISMNWAQKRRTSLGPLAGVPSDLLTGLPSNLPGRILMKAANFWYRKGMRTGARQADLKSVLYPLDRLPNWNTLFGQPGFFQHQCVLPEGVAATALDQLFKVVENGCQSPSLGVGKWFGPRPSQGLLSFPVPGFSLALDFANRGSVTRQLLDKLDKVVVDQGGRLYPAKDARMSPSSFSSAYPAVEQFTRQIDPLFASDFWRRMGKAE